MLTYFLDSCFRSRRVQNTLDKFAKINDITFDSNNAKSWTSTDGTRCLIIDTGELLFLHLEIPDKIINFVSKKAITGDEQFYILLADLDSKDSNDMNKKIKLTKCVHGTSPCIYVYSLHPRIDVQRLLETFANRNIHLVNGFYGPCRNKFDCYTKSIHEYSQIDKPLPNYNTDGSGGMCVSGASSNNQSDGILFALLAIDMCL